MLVVALAHDARCTAASQSTPPCHQVHAEERTMWRRGFRPALLPTRTLHSRILPCCHHCSRTTRTAWTVMDDPRSQSIRHAWNWSKIKPDPKKPFFAQRSTRNTPHTAVVLLRNADIPMLQIKPPVFLPATAEQGTSRSYLSELSRMRLEHGLSNDTHTYTLILPAGCTNSTALAQHPPLHV